MNPKQVLSRLRTWVEDEVLTAPSGAFKPACWGCDEKSVAEHADRLRREGYTSLGRIFDAAELAAIRSRIDDAVAGRAPGVQAIWQDSAYWLVRSPLRLYRVLLATAAHPLAIAVAERYFMRPAYLGDADLRRVMPITTQEIEKKRGYSSSNWHRDIRGRQVKVMIYLSDVGPGDSCFAFLPRTHLGQYSRNKTYLNTRFADSDAEAMAIPIQEWQGAAGEAMLFDTNILHRLSRRPEARVRDSITYYYTPGQTLFPLDYDSADLARLPAAARRILGEPGGLMRRRARTSSDAVNDV